MRILASSDLHGDQRLAERLAEEAEENQVDLVLLCGDLTHNDLSSDNLIGPFKKRGLKVAFVPGNHDSPATADFLAQRYEATNLHGYSMVLDDVGLFGCGHANCGPHFVDEEEISSMLGKGFAYIEGTKKKVMVTHLHPSGTILERFSQFVSGSPAVRAAIDRFKPDILLCGHVHEAQGIEEKVGDTRVINVSRSSVILDL